MKKNKLYKFFHWEYWPAFMFYIPNVPYGFYLALKAKNLVFFSAANPAIKSSGNGTESKYKTLMAVPKNYKPKSIFHTANSNITKTLQLQKKHKIAYPLIAKPDIGCRGLLVEKITCEEALKTYLTKHSTIDIIIQEFIDYKNECGIFYYRNPNEEKGCISSITLKHFLTVTGDGKTTLKALILKDKRAKLYVDFFAKIHQEKLESIPKKEAVIKLSSIGNHSKGTQFLNGNHLISKQLTATFDAFSKSIPGFFYGRIDVKYNDFESLANGTDFKVLEINGIMAEPTHIYDTEKGTYLNALKAIRNHWKSLFEIATTNHKEHHISYKSTRKFVQEVIKLRAYTKKMKKVSENA